MANGKHSIELPISIQEIWNYISDIDKWATTVPGYESHEIVNEKQSTWAIKGDMGILKKTAKLKVEITEWVEPKIEPEAKGPMASMQKTVLKKFVPKTTKDMTTAVVNEVRSLK